MLASCIRLLLDEGSVGLREAFSAMRWETRLVKGIKDMFYYVSVLYAVSCNEII